MAIFVANYCCKLSNHFQNRVYSLIRLKCRIGAAAFAQSRIYSSSGFVRYIPKEKRDLQTCPTGDTTKTKQVIQILKLNASGGENGGQGVLELNTNLCNQYRMTDVKHMNNVIYTDPESHDTTKVKEAIWILKSNAAGGENDGQGAFEPNRNLWNQYRNTVDVSKNDVLYTDSESSDISREKQAIQILKLNTSGGENGGKEAFELKTNLWNQYRITDDALMNDHKYTDSKSELEEESKLVIEGLDSEAMEDKFPEHDVPRDTAVSGVNRTKLQANKMAIKFLARRALSAFELQEKLVANGIPVAVADGMIMDFQSRGWLKNDCSYAETYSRSKWSSHCWGPRRIKRELMRKGVKKCDAETGLKRVFKREAYDDGDEEEENRLDMSNLKVEELYVRASKQWLKSRNVVDRRKRVSRIVSWLKYRGFDSGVIQIILQKLISR